MKICFWIWVAIIIILNVIHLGNSVNERLTSKEFAIRLDYLVHLAIFLVFGWISLVGKLLKTVVPMKAWWLIALAIGVEGMQYWLPYRAFNPVDLVYNLIGAGVSGLIVKRVHADYRGKKR